MSIRKYFEEQLASSAPITSEQLEQMREYRRSVLTPEQYELAAMSGRLATDELVGRSMLFYMVSTPVPPPQHHKLEVMRVVDDELDNFGDNMRFCRMSGSVPVFEVIQ